MLSALCFAPNDGEPKLAIASFHPHTRARPTSPRVPPNVVMTDKKANEVDERRAKPQTAAENERSDGEKNVSNSTNDVDTAAIIAVDFIFGEVSLYK